MPALQSLVLTDRQTTPVNFTLLPVGQKDGMATVAVADSSGSLISEKRFQIGNRRSADRIRTTIKLKCPIIVVETINGVASSRVEREAFVDCTFNFSVNSTTQERNDVVGMFASAFTTTKLLVHDTLVKGESVY